MPSRDLDPLIYLPVLRWDIYGPRQPERVRTICRQEQCRRLFRRFGTCCHKSMITDALWLSGVTMSDSEIRRAKRFVREEELREADETNDD